MNARICCVLLNLILYCIITGTSTALECYSCGWISGTDRDKCVTSVEEGEEDLTYPLPATCIRTRDNRPPTEDELRTKCPSIPCAQKNPSCLRWSFLTSGSPENITYKCVGNPGNRRGHFLMDISDPDEQKKYNKKTLRVEVYLCHEDNCNRAALPSPPPHGSTLIAIALVLWNALMLTSRT